MMDHRTHVTDDNRDQKCPRCGRIVTENYGEQHYALCVWCRNGY